MMRKAPASPGAFCFWRRERRANGTSGRVSILFATKRRNSVEAVEVGRWPETRALAELFYGRRNADDFTGVVSNDFDRYCQANESASLGDSGRIRNVRHVAAPGPDKLVESRPVARPEIGRDDQIERLPDRLVSRVAEKLFGFGVPNLDDSLPVHAYSGRAQNHFSAHC